MKEHESIAAQSGPAKRTSLKIALAGGLSLPPLLLIDCFFHQPFIQFLFDHSWYLLLCLATLLAFLLSILLCVLHDLMLPPEKAWSTSDRTENGGLIFIFAVFFPPILYFTTLFLMIHTGIGSGGE